MWEAVHMRNSPLSACNAGSISVQRTLELALEAEQVKNRCLQEELERVKTKLAMMVSQTGFQQESYQQGPEVS